MTTGGSVTPADRSRVLKQQPLTLWLTGYSASGKSTLAYHLERHLINIGHAAFTLDGDQVRSRLNRDLDFSEASRNENIRRAAEVARMMNDAGLIVVSSFISPYRSDRELAREAIGSHRFAEIHINTPISECEKRDPKGLYRRARAGELAAFTGVSAPYESPENPALMLDTSQLTLSDCLDRMMQLVSLYQSPPHHPTRQPEELLARIPPTPSSPAKHEGKQ